MAKLHFVALAFPSQYRGLSITYSSMKSKIVFQLKESFPDPTHDYNEGKVESIRFFYVHDFLKNNSEDISPFCGATYTIVLDFW